MATKIIIAGIGGVGGYFGGLLAKHYVGNAEVEVVFYARGQHLEEIRDKGLKVIKGEHEFIAKPFLATDQAAEIGVADIIIIATKSYDLESVIEELRPCIRPETIILPLLNGVDSRERIKKILPDNMVLDGCVYLVARLKQAGVIENTGNIQTLYFGLDNFENDRLSLLEKLFKQAGIEATLSRNISSIMWEKFIFISPTATATSFFDLCIGELMADKNGLDTVSKLIEEVKQIAIAHHITIAEDITVKTLNKLRSLPFNATSSMHSDFQNNKPFTELESLTGYVVEEAKKNQLDTPMYHLIYSVLKRKREI